MNQISILNLKSGKVFNLDNEQHCIDTQSDDLRSAEVLFDDNKQAWAKGFKIWFNGALVHSSKTFPSMERKLKQLIKTWNLKIVT